MSLSSILGRLLQPSTALLRTYTKASLPLSRALHRPTQQAHNLSHEKATITVCRRPYSSKVQLRGYQEECIQAVLQALSDGYKRVGVSLATGSGKTIIFTQLIQRIVDRSRHGTQTLILAHRRELVEQAAKHCANAYPDARIDIEMGSLHASGTADITIASLQSITSKDRLDKFDPERFKLVLVDEAHHIVAPGYMRVLRHFGLADKVAESPALVGVSATFSRFDGLRLGAAIDEIVYHKDYVDMIGEKWLSDVVFTTVESTADVTRVRNAANGDFQTGELSRAVNTDEVNEVTVRSWLARAKDRKSTLVFCVDLAHVAGLTAKFRQHGLDARFVTGDTPRMERGDILDAFKKGEFPVLINCGVFTEGTDIPNIDCIVLARPTRSRNLLVQMIGRGMRLHKGKSNCHIIDMVSSLDTGIVTTPTLFGLDPGQLVDKANMDDIRNLQKCRDAEASRQSEAYSGENDATARPLSGPASVSFTDYDSVFDLIEDTSGEKHIHTISQYAWVQVGPDRYVLTSPNGSYVRLEKVEKVESSSSSAIRPSTVQKDHESPDQHRQQNSPMTPLFRANYFRALPPGTAKSPYAAPRELLKAATFPDAVHGTDKWASENFPHVFIHRYQRWRQGQPTQGQLDFLNKLRRGPDGTVKPEDVLTAENLTKGRAMDMITKVKHGARGRFADIKAGERKAKRKTEKLEQRRVLKEREQVTVGPVTS